MQQEATRPVCYAAAFCEGGKPVACGAIVVEEGRLRLRGRSDEGPVELDVSYDEVLRLRLPDTSNERLNGYRTIVLERKAQSPIQVAPLGVGCCSELADALGTRLTGRSQTTEQIAIVVALKQGHRESVRTLIDQGPPFDASSLGLTRHEVFLTDDEAVFVLEGRDVRDVLWRAVEQPGFWRAGLAWRRHTTGAPRLSKAPFDAAVAGEPAYRWTADGSAPPDPTPAERGPDSGGTIEPEIRVLPR